MTVAQAPVTTPANPFAQDVDERLPPPSTLVLFGATGDLAARKLLPAVYDLLADGRLPERFRLLAVVRSSQDDASFRAHARRDRRARPSAARRAAVGRPRAAHRRGRGRLRQRRVVRRARAAARRGRPRGRRALAAALLPRDLPRLLRRDGAQARRRRARPRRRPADAAADREAVRPRPGERARAERGGRGVVRGAPGLPHRPLPRQGDGPEPAGAALRQRHLRAAVEPHARSTTSRSPSPRTSASATAPATTTAPARCAT